MKISKSAGDINGRVSYAYKRAALLLVSHAVDVTVAADKIGRRNRKSTRDIHKDR